MRSFFFLFLSLSLHIWLKLFRLTKLYRPPFYFNHQPIIEIECQPFLSLSGSHRIYGVFGIVVYVRVLYNLELFLNRIKHLCLPKRVIRSVFT